MIEKCENCAFGVSFDGLNLDCHRHAPTALIQWTGFSDGKDLFQPSTHWPRVRKDYFCSDFELKG